MKEKKPDGYIAWHPRHGLDRHCFSIEFGEVVRNLTKNWENSGEKYKTPHPLNWGWVIRPVQITFLDEVKEEI